jgi:hypothetical protein
MVWLYFGFTVLFLVAELWSFFVARKRKLAVIDYVREKHPAFFSGRLETARDKDIAAGDFLRSPEDLGDPQLGLLKKQARFASKLGMAPIFFLLAVMLVLYLWGAVLSFFK